MLVCCSKKKNTNKIKQNKKPSNLTELKKTAQLKRLDPYGNSL